MSLRRVEWWLAALVVVAAVTVAVLYLRREKSPAFVRIESATLEKSDEELFPIGTAVILRSGDTVIRIPAPQGSCWDDPQVTESGNAALAAELKPFPIRKRKDGSADRAYNIGDCYRFSISPTLEGEHAIVLLQADVQKHFGASSSFSKLRSVSEDGRRMIVELRVGPDNRHFSYDLHVYDTKSQTFESVKP